MTAMARASLRLLAVVLTGGLTACQTVAQVATSAPVDKLDATLSAVARNGVAPPALWYFEPGIAEPLVENDSALRRQSRRSQSARRACAVGTR